MADDEKNISPGSIAAKIRRFREMRGLTQKQLGILCGFPERSAASRIGQYENGLKVPQEKMITQLAAALNVYPAFFSYSDMSSLDIMEHSLFDMEDFFGVHPVKRQDGSFYLDFRSEDGVKDMSFANVVDFLEAWNEAYRQYKPDLSDSPETRKRKVQDYDIWKAEYPLNMDSDRMLENVNRLEAQRLQGELDELNGQINSAQIVSRIDKECSDNLKKIRAEGSSMRYESDLIFLAKDMLEEGMDVINDFPGISSEEDPQHLLLLEFRADDILKTDKTKQLFAHFLYAVEEYQKSGISINRKIHFNKKWFFLGYYYPIEQEQYFKNFNRYWYDIENIAAYKRRNYKRAAADLEAEIKAAVTGKNDKRLIE